MSDPSFFDFLQSLVQHPRETMRRVDQGRQAQASRAQGQQFADRVIRQVHDEDERSRTADARYGRARQGLRDMEARDARQALARAHSHDRDPGRTGERASRLQHGGEFGPRPEHTRGRDANVTNVEDLWNNAGDMDDVRNFVNRFGAEQEAVSDVSHRGPSREWRQLYGQANEAARDASDRAIRTALSERAAQGHNLDRFNTNAPLFQPDTEADDSGRLHRTSEEGIRGRIRGRYPELEYHDPRGRGALEGAHRERMRIALRSISAPHHYDDSGAEVSDMPQGELRVAQGALNDNKVNRSHLNDTVHQFLNSRSTDAGARQDTEEEQPRFDERRRRRLTENEGNYTL